MGRKLTATGDVPKSPATAPVEVRNIPRELREIPQWVCWKWVWRQESTRDGAWAKIPIQPDGETWASSTDPETWGNYSEAMEAASSRDLPGIGYVFTLAAGLVGIDLDGCRDRDTGEILPWAAEILADLDSYSEVSPSGRGVKVIVRGKLPAPGRRKPIKDLPSTTPGVVAAVEVYREGRYFTITGQRLPDLPDIIEERQAALDRLWNRFFVPPPKEPPAAQQPKTVSLDDTRLIDKAKASKTRFADLWGGSTASYSGDDSCADLALCSYLAFWCGPDKGRIDRLFRQSGLMRGKWDERRGAKTYGERTIDVALEGKTVFYDPNYYETKVTTNGTAGATHEANGKPPPIADNSLIIWGDTITPEKVDWFWKDRIPFEFITLFAGRTGVGKSFAASDLIARFTSGRSLPYSEGWPLAAGRALIISEDHQKVMLAPRLIEMGAKMKSVAFMTYETMGIYQLANVELLERTWRQARDAELIMIDPPTNFMEGIDEHKNTEVRRVLNALSSWLEGRHVAIIMITHLNKSVGKGLDALSRIIGSVAFGTTCRIAHTFSPHPDNAGEYICAVPKTNLGPIPPALSYRIVKTASLATLEWLGEVDITADEAVAGTSTARKPRGVVAVEWITKQFRDKREWLSEDLHVNGRKCGVSRNAFFTPEVQALPITKKQHTNANGEQYWTWTADHGWPPPVEPESQK